MPDIGKNVIGELETSVKQVMEDLANQKKKEDKSHYFYILQMPACGGNRIKIGKSSALYSRFKYYQAHFFGSEITVLKLRKFNNTDMGRFTDNAMKLYTLFEREAKHYLREYNRDKNKKNKLGKITEWFEAEEKKRLLAGFEAFLIEFQRKSFAQIPVRKSTRSKNPINVSDGESSEDDDVPVNNKPISRTSNRRKTPVQSYKV